jgi:hypothetical protein
MNRILSLGWAGIVVGLFAACGGSKDPEACPVLPACITGSTWNATSCACVLDDEPGHAGDAGLADRPASADERVDASDESTSDAPASSTDATEEPNE